MTQSISQYLLERSYRKGEVQSVVREQRWAVHCLGAALLLGCNGFSEGRPNNLSGPFHGLQSELAVSGPLDCGETIQTREIVTSNGVVTIDAAALSRCERDENNLPIVRMASELSAEKGCIPADALPTAQKNTPRPNGTCLLLDQAETKFCQGQGNTSGANDAQGLDVTVLVANSNRTLDCQGETIDHGYWEVPREQCACRQSASASSPLHCACTDSCDDPSSPDTRRAAIRFTKHASLVDVTIRDCKIQHTGFSAVELARTFRGAEVADVEAGEIVGHSSVVIESVVTNNSKFGAYVGQSSRNVSIRDSSFVASRNLGIYLEADTQDTVIENTTVAWSLSREGLAVDSSTRNIVRNSSFSNNCGYGRQAQGVVVYHNCGELKGVVCPIKRGPAEFNLIEGNYFDGDQVVVGSRQGTYHGAGWCEDLNGEQGYQFDQARNNSISGNVFYMNRARPSLRIQDGNTRVSHNHFSPRTSEDEGATALHFDDGHWGIPAACSAVRPTGVDVTDNAVSNNDFFGCNGACITRDACAEVVGYLELNRRSVPAPIVSIL